MRARCASVSSTEIAPLKSFCLDRKIDCKNIRLVVADSSFDLENVLLIKKVPGLINI